MSAGEARHAAARSETVALFVTCLVDELFPAVGEAAVRLVERTGARILCPAGQTCCGQPAFNLGYRDEARRLAERWVRLFEPYDAIVAPSGSCTTMVRVFYAELFDEDPPWRERARAVAARTFELTELLDRRGLADALARDEPFPVTVTYHDACHLRRELGIVASPRALLAAVPGLRLVEMARPDLCCGFGGAFSVELPELSEAMAEDKLAEARATGAAVLTATDAGCLMHLGGALHRRGDALRAIHIARVLARDLEG